MLKSVSTFAQAITILTLITISLTFFAVRTVSSAKALSKRESFVLISNSYNIEKGVIQPVHARTITAVDPQKNLIKVTHSFLNSGKTQILVGDVNAVYEMTEDALQYRDIRNFTNEMDKNTLDENFLRNNPLFVREDNVLGYKVFVFRTESPDSWQEQYYSTLTGSAMLKSVIFNKKTQTQNIQEAISLEIRTLKESEIGFPVMPIKYDHVEQLIAQLEKSGNPNGINQANFKKANLERIKALNTTTQNR